MKKYIIEILSLFLILVVIFFTLGTKKRVDKLENKIDNIIMIMQEWELDK